MGRAGTAMRRLSIFATVFLSVAVLFGCEHSLHNRLAARARARASQACMVCRLTQSASATRRTSTKAVCGPVAFALKKLTAAEEAMIRALVKKAVS
jgi:hypothetical protein